jgi:ABC-type branched-subunit amino acid transport system substrate-binding protein
MSGSRVPWWRGVALVAVVSLIAGAGIATSAAAQKFPAVDQPGVSDDEIRVGGVVTVTQSVTGASYGGAFDGVDAYFDYINKTQGGVYGRKLVLASKRDDQFSKNRQEVQGLLSEDDVFAALPMATNLFSGAQLLVDGGVPTFGWDIQAEFGSEKNKPGPPNLFGAAGSFICFTCANASTFVWLPKKLHRQNIGIIAYNVEQSADCATGAKNSIQKFKAGKVVFEDNSLQFGNPDFSAQVAQMKEKNVNFIISCIDFNGDLNMIREMKRQGLDAIQSFPNAYEHSFVKENAEFLNGNYLFTLFAPLETKPAPEGVKLYKKWLKKTGGKDTENSVFGWINADLFVEGLKAAGPDFTRQKVIDAINKMKNYTAKGLLPGVDWTQAHENDYDCAAIMKIVNGTFKPVFGKPGKPFVCFDDAAATLPNNPAVK